MNIPLKCIFPISEKYLGSKFSFSCQADKRQEDLRLVPILVGQASAQQGAQLVKVLEPYFKDPETYFIISSDFCHWQVHPSLSMI
jgi:predicted class III extradiol MEMO1 family dioxygenase